MQQPLFEQGEHFVNQTQSILLIPFGENGADYTVVMVVESFATDAFDESLRESFTTLVRNGSSAFEKAILHTKMRELATTDGLTKLMNHRTFQDKLHDSILHCHRYKRPLSLLLFDIDHFKNFNDTYGHQIGDLVLQKLSRALEASVRSTDMPARYGGEEFVVILPETDLDAAVQLAERIRQAISMVEILTETEKLHVTVSIGVAVLGPYATTQEQLIGASDTAMYLSKKDGRNRVTVYQPWMASEISS